MHTVSLQATLLPLGFCYSAARGKTFPFPASNKKKKAAKLQSKKEKEKESLARFM